MKEIRLKSLWPGSRYSQSDRDSAIERGLTFVAQVASNPQHFADWGHDLLWCFYSISSTAGNQDLRAMAHGIGQERAYQWRHDHPELRFECADDITNLVFGSHASDLLLGRHDDGLRAGIEAGAARYCAVDFLEFDPRREPPPSDLPDSCPECEHQNLRGAAQCERCAASLALRSPYDIWSDALVTAYSGEAYGVTLGASYADVLQWISVMRPYPAGAQLQASQKSFDDVTYAITHVVYTLNEYGKYRLPAEGLPQEFLLSNQNPDGSWGHVNDDDIYNRYHSTWTAIDGLREYVYCGERCLLGLPLGHIQESALNQC